MGAQVMLLVKENEEERKKRKGEESRKMREKGRIICGEKYNFKYNSLTK